MKWLWCFVLVVVTGVTDQSICGVEDPPNHTQYVNIKSLPTNITFDPLGESWWLNFTFLQRAGLPPLACVHLEGNTSVTSMMLFEGDCIDGILLNTSYVLRDSASLQVLDTIGQDIEKILKGTNFVVAQADETTQDITASKGCHVNCPTSKYSSGGPDKRMTIKKFQKDDMFYFFPGEDFIKLYYEVTCTTLNGTEKILPITDIKLEDKNLCYFVMLQHLDDKVLISLNHTSLKIGMLPKNCIFVEHTIKLVGDSHFSFCNSYEKVNAEIINNIWFYSNNNNTCSANYEPNSNLVTILDLMMILLTVSIVLIAWLVKKYQHVKDENEALKCE